MVKRFFLNIKDYSGIIQIYTSNRELSVTDYKTLSKLKIGDISSFLGNVYKTKKNELSLKTKKINLLVKIQKPFFDKRKGIENEEILYRQRYLAFLSNNNLMNVLRKRIKIIKKIRLYLDSHNFKEVETPILHEIYGGAAAVPFITHHNSLKQNFFLRIATEIYLKKLLVGGFDRVYEIGRIFRNEGLSPKHNPEFTSIEIYQAYANYKDMMLLVKSLIQYLVKYLSPDLNLKYNNAIINFSDKNWTHISMIQAIKKYTQIDCLLLKSLNDAVLVAKKLKVKIKKHHNTIGIIINRIFEKCVEKKLINPTIVYNYPIDVSPFAIKCEDNDNFSERFELFIGGMEIANAFSELNDPDIQIKNFETQKKQENLGYKESYKIDEDFINALKYGMPPSGGIGIGIDRLVMLLTNSKSIKDVIFFPTLKKVVKNNVN